MAVISICIQRVDLVVFLNELSMNGQWVRVNAQQLALVPTPSKGQKD